MDILIKKRKKIIAIFLIVILSFSFFIQFSDIYAAITNTNTDKTPEEIAVENTAEAETTGKFSAVVSKIASAIGSVFLYPLTQLVVAFAAILYIVLSIVFLALGINNGLGFPLVDDLVFNQVGFFDPNFINPTTMVNSPARIMQTTVSSLYYSLFAIAGTVFVIAALVIGIKLALSSIASEKAQYKQAIMNWVVGLVMLCTVHFIMAGIFYINEQVCQAAYNTTKNGGINIKITTEDVTTAAGGALMGQVGVAAGKTINTVINGALGFWGKLTNQEIETPSFDVKGFAGVMMKLILQAVGR